MHISLKVLYSNANPSMFADSVNPHIMLCREELNKFLNKPYYSASYIINISTHPFDGSEAFRIINPFDGYVDLKNEHRTIMLTRHQTHVFYRYFPQNTFTVYIRVQKLESNSN